MRTSQKVLFSAAGILVAGIIFVGLLGRVALSQVEPRGLAGQAAQSSAPDGTQSYDLRDFVALDIEGAWRVTVMQGERWQVRVTYPEGLQDEIDVYVDGEELNLDRNRPRGWRWWGRDETPVLAEIVMPQLERLSSAGASDIDLSGFDGEQLELHVAGAVQIEGRNGAYEEIDISAAGASHIDLREIVTVDARVDLAGASDVTLTMNGGVLRGSMAGAGSVSYYGTVADERIDIAGIGSVSRVD